MYTIYMYPTLPSSLRIAIIRGGPSSDYDLSLASGGVVLKHLSETHKPLDIFISRDGKWHINGIERSPERILNHVDVVWNALHGTYGEDGSLQALLDRHNILYTGSNRLASAIAINTALTKERAAKIGIKTPVYALVRQEDHLATRAKEIFNSMPHPLIVKPACGGGSLGMYRVDSYHELLSALETVLSEHGSALVEEYIVGNLASCMVTDDFRGQDVYAFPPISHTHTPLSKDEKTKMEEVSKRLHRELGLSHYSESNFVISPKRGVHFLKVKTTPETHEKSILHHVLETVGVDTVHFIHHLLSLAVNKK